jgi:Permeases of the major facilitator superfamily
MGIVSTATSTVVARIIPDERRSEGTGYYALSTTVAASIGPFLGMFIIGHASYEYNFIVCIILLLFSFVAVFFVKALKLESNTMTIPKGMYPLVVDYAIPQYDSTLSCQAR